MILLSHFLYGHHALIKRSSALYLRSVPSLSLVNGICRRHHWYHCPNLLLITGIYFFVVKSVSPGIAAVLQVHESKPVSHDPD